MAQIISFDLRPSAKSGEMILGSKSVEEQAGILFVLRKSKRIEYGAVDFALLTAGSNL
jgi:hypothetical protein